MNVGREQLAKPPIFAVLTWHRVIPESSRACLGGHRKTGIVTEWSTFLGQLDTLQRKATIVSLAEAVSGLTSGAVPPRAVVLTFDDGFSEHIDLVAPELIRRDLAATLFVCGVSLEPAAGLRWLEWYDLIEEASMRRRGCGIAAGLKRHLRTRGAAEREKVLRALSHEFGVLESERKELRNSLFATPQQLLSLGNVSRMAVGGHSFSHPSLAHIEPREKRNEIRGCRDLLLRVVRGTRPAFAYPFGGADSYDAECARLVAECGYMCACTSIPGYNRGSTSRFELRRFDMNRFQLSEVLDGLG